MFITLFHCSNVISSAAYSIIPNAKIALGVEILKERTFIVAVNLLGEIIGQATIDLHFKPDTTYYTSISAAILDLKESLNLKVENIIGAGFGLQGLVSNDGQTIIYGKILDCTGLSIHAFSAHLPFPCRFIHDSECAALCDMWNNPDISNALYLSIGRHLGGALILNGEISVGRTGRSGTFEHMTLVPNGKSCYCGQNGCIECYCSIQALLEDYYTNDIEVFFRNKSNGEADASKKWRNFLINLATAIQNRTAFPEEDCFLIQGGQRKEAVTTGAALPFIKEYLAKIKTYKKGKNFFSS